MKKVLVVGPTGNLGPHVVDGLVKYGHQVSAMLREGSMNDHNNSDRLTSLGAKLIPGDMSNPASLKNACQGHEVIVSCIGAEHIPDQVALARIAQESGVERFVPSEFGVDPFLAAPGSCDLFDLKKAVQQDIKETRIGFTPIYNNGFMEFWATGLGQLGPTSPPESVQVFGNGETAAYMTSLPYIGRYVAAIIDDPETLNKEVLIAANKASQNEMIATWEDISGNTIQKEFVSAQQVEKIIEDVTASGDIMSLIFTQLHRSVWIKGEGNTKRSGVLDAVQRYPSIRPMGLTAYLEQFI